jgi:uncharacterized protein
MHGFQLTFFTQQDHKQDGLPLAEWLVREARQLKIGGATLVAAAEGYGRDRKLHAARFFELGDQPLEVTLAVTADEAEQLFAHLAEHKVKVFYVKMPIEFGVSGED